MAQKNKKLQRKRNTGKKLNDKNSNSTNLADSVEFADEPFTDYNRDKKNKINRKKGGDGC